MKNSTRPFPETLMALLEEQDLSQRELVRRLKANGWGSITTVQFLVHGEMDVTRRAMEEIARALQLRPEHFAEYRLMEARDELDPSVVGLERALRALAARSR